MENDMSKAAAAHHLKAVEHHEHAARHHREAAKHHEAGNHEKAAHHAHLAHGHHLHATEYAGEAAKAHIKAYGKKEHLRGKPLPPSRDQPGKGEGFPACAVESQRLQPQGHSSVWAAARSHPVIFCILGAITAAQGSDLPD